MGSGSMRASEKATAHDGWWYERWMRKDSNRLGLLNPGEDIVKEDGVSSTWLPKEQEITTIIPKNHILD